MTPSACGSPLVPHPEAFSFNILEKALFGVHRDATRNTDPGYMSRNIDSLEGMNLTRETNGSFDSWNSYQRLRTSRLHELHESKLPFVESNSTSNLSVRNFEFYVHVSGVKYTVRSPSPKICLKCSCLRECHVKFQRTLAIVSSMGHWTITASNLLSAARHR